MDEAIMKFILELANTLQANPEEVVKAALQNPDALKNAVTKYQETLDILQAAQAFSESLQQYAKHGAKLAYINKLNKKCPEGYELTYFKKGGKAGCGCTPKIETGDKLEKNCKGSKFAKKGKIKFSTGGFFGVNPGGKVLVRDKGFSGFGNLISDEQKTKLLNNGFLESDFSNVTSFQNALNNYFKSKGLGTVKTDGKWGNQTLKAFDTVFDDIESQPLNTLVNTYYEPKPTYIEYQLVNPIKYNKSMVRDFIRDKGIGAYDFSGSQKKALRHFLNREASDEDIQTVKNMKLLGMDEMAKYLKKGGDISFMRLGRKTKYAMKDIYGKIYYYDSEAQRQEALQLQRGLIRGSKKATAQFHARPQVLRADRTAEGTQSPTSYTLYKTFKEAYNAARKNKDMYFDWGPKGKEKVYRTYDNPNETPSNLNNNKAAMISRYGTYLGWSKDPNFKEKSIQHVADVRNGNLGKTTVEREIATNPAEPIEYNNNNLSRWQLFENWRPEDYETLANKTAAAGAGVAATAAAPMIALEAAPTMMYNASQAIGNFALPTSNLVGRYFVSRGYRGPGSKIASNLMAGRNWYLGYGWANKVKNAGLAIKEFATTPVSGGSNSGVPQFLYFKKKGGSLNGIPFYQGGTNEGGILDNIKIQKPIIPYVLVKPQLLPQITINGIRRKNLPNFTVIGQNLNKTYPFPYGEIIVEKSPENGKTISYPTTNSPLGLLVMKSKAIRNARGNRNGDIF